jgi:hypothetical protein
MAMFTGYFDESETHGRLLVVAGYIARSARWRKFHREWRDTLLPLGVDPAITPFHMAAFEARKQPWMQDDPFVKAISHWSDEVADKALNDLTEVINQNAAVGIAVAVELEDYERVALRVREPNSAYTFCVIRCLYQAIRWADYQREREEIVYVFEDGAGHNKEVNAAASRIHGRDDWRQRYRMGGLSFRKKSEVLELQSADIGAWEGRRYCVSDSFHTRVGMRESAQALLHGLLHGTEYWNEAELERLVAHVARKRAEAEQSALMANEDIE